MEGETFTPSAQEEHQTTVCVVKREIPFQGNRTSPIRSEALGSYKAHSVKISEDLHYFHSLL